MGIRTALITVRSTRLLSSANHNGPHEGDESNEGDEGRQRCHDCDAGVWFHRRNHWIEVERREGRCRGHRYRRGRPVEEKRFLQARRCVEPEAEEEARPTSS